MSFIESAVVQECLRQYPNAVSEVEAVDLAAQDLFAKIKADAGTEFDKNRYCYLNMLRKELYSRKVESMSSYLMSVN